MQPSRLVPERHQHNFGLNYLHRMASNAAKGREKRSDWTSAGADAKQKFGGAQQIARALGIQGGDRLVNGPIEGVNVDEGLMREMMGFQFAQTISTSLSRERIWAATRC